MIETTEQVTCPMCHGSGEVTQYSYQVFKTIEYKANCHRCMGMGWISKTTIIEDAKEE
jgi:DnaJ-class molecular chaperone